MNASYADTLWLLAVVIRVAGTTSYVKWRETGSEFIGKRVKRVFGRRVAGAVVTKWVPQEENKGLALWHVQHDDGDEVRRSSSSTRGRKMFWWEMLMEISSA